MAKLSAELLVLCDQAIVSQEGKLSLIGIFNQILVHRLPSRFWRFFAVAIIAGELNNEHQLRLEVLSPANQPVHQQHLSLKIGPNGKANLIATISALPLPTVGTYTLYLKHQRHTLVSTQFQVINVKHPQPSTSTLPN